MRNETYLRGDNMIQGILDVKNGTRLIYKLIKNGVVVYEDSINMIGMYTDPDKAAEFLIKKASTKFVW